MVSAPGALEVLSEDGEPDEVHEAPALEALLLQPRLNAVAALQAVPKTPWIRRVYVRDNFSHAELVERPAEQRHFGISAVATRPVLGKPDERAGLGESVLRSSRALDADVADVDCRLPSHPYRESDRVGAVLRKPFLFLGLGHRLVRSEEPSAAGVVDPRPAALEVGVAAEQPEINAMSREKERAHTNLLVISELH